VRAAELSATATQTREDAVAPGQMRITETNTSTRELTVTSVALDSPGFAPAPASPRDDPFPPGVRYALPARYGEPRCTLAPLPATAVVQAHARTGPSVTLRLPLNSSDGLLERLHEQACRTARLAQRVRLSVVDLAPAGPAVLRGTVRIQRRAGAGPIALTEVRDSVVFTLRLPLPAVLPVGSDRLDVPLEVRMASCSGHVIGEAKQPYLFPAFLRLDGAQAQLDLPTTSAEHRLLQELVRTGCAGEQGGPGASG